MQEDEEKLPAPDVYSIETERKREKGFLGLCQIGRLWKYHSDRDEESDKNPLRGRQSNFHFVWIGSTSVELIFQGILVEQPSAQKYDASGPVQMNIFLATKTFNRLQIEDMRVKNDG